MNEMAPRKYGMGANVRRKEDKALITGAGRFVDDYTPAGTLRAHVLHSTMAHARVKVGDVATAREMPGVRLVLTGADVKDYGGLACKIHMNNLDGSKMPHPFHPILVQDVTRHVGEPIAFVVADTLEQAKAAAETIEVDYEPLPVVVDMKKALEKGAPVIHPEAGSNRAFETGKGNKADTDAAFAKAAKVSRVEIVNNRLVSNYMETRGIVAEYDAATGRFTLTMGTQGGHGMRDRIAKDVLRIDPKNIRVITPDVGGGFGTKAFPYHEYPLAAIAARELGRPVKWVGDANGKFLAMRVELLANMGAYLSQYGPDIPIGGLTMTTGLYDIAHMWAHCIGVYTNTVTVDAYRGAGRPEAAYLVERLVDQCGRDTGLGPIEIRKRNFIQTAALPYHTQGGRIYDSGEFAGHLDRALEAADWKGFEGRAAEAKKRGAFRGFGVASYVEACAFPGSEPATVTLHKDGTATLFIGTQTNGQGHATAYSQFIAGHLGLEYEQIKVVQGDTDQVAQGEGTGGSRSIPIGAVSTDRAAARLASQLKDMASEKLEASADDLEIAGGRVTVAGTDRGITLVELATQASDPKLLTAVGDFEQPEPTYPNGTHAVEVEIDPETGVTTVVNYTIVDDFGATVNPTLLAGQVHGGVIQGIGQALYEQTVYDDDGQLLTASFLDYTMPRADGVPSVNFETRNVPCKTNAFGIKGAGEAGSIGSCPSVMNAIVDALNRGAGVTAIDMPATPEKVWSLIQSARK